MSTYRDQVIEHLRKIFGSDNALDLFVSGLDDPKFDPDKPYYGRRMAAPIEDYLASDAGKMLMDMMEFNLQHYQRYLDLREVENAYTTYKLVTSPDRQVFSVSVP